MGSDSKSSSKSSGTQQRLVASRPTYRHAMVEGIRPMSDKVKRISDDAKSRHRTDLPVHQWGKDGFAGSDVCDLPLADIADSSISREHTSNLTPERFFREYEIPAVPVVIDGIPTAENWSATENWTLRNLKTSFRQAMFKCGEDDSGKTIRMKFKYFYKYMKSQTDDSPLYIFDSSFEDRKDTAPLMQDYKVPRYFPDDLFSLVGEDDRPPYRWFLVGPKRSGTVVHIDPLGTSAWNTLLSGRKRWVLFPPSTPKSFVKGKDFILPREDDEAINYFADILPRMLNSTSGSQHTVIEFIQYPGETVFIPGGWWHGVFNLDDTVAVTQNFCSHRNFERVWKKTRSGRKRMAVKWLSALETQYPSLANTARELNTADGYEMYQKKRRSSTPPEVLDDKSSKKSKKKK